MKKVKVILPTIVPVLLITGILAVSGHAKKPGTVVAVVTGDLSGSGNPETIALEFSITFDDQAGPQTGGPLEVFGVRTGVRTISYWYGSDPLKRLLIYGGALKGKAKDTQIVWPAGSYWEIRNGQGVWRSGTLIEGVIYK